MPIPERRIHAAFQVSILIKGALATVECLSGVLVAVTSTQQIKSLVDRLVRFELIEDRSAFIASHLSAWAQTFSVESQHFYAFYLLTHGAAKLALVVGLLMGRLWAYPASLVLMTMFIAYQLYRYSYTHSIWLIVLTVFDIFVLGLIWHEYRLVRRYLPTE